MISSPKDERIAIAYAIRPAVQADQPAITAIVRAAGINPFSLHWQRFLVAEEGGRIIGLAQVKPHRDGSRELASLAVIPERQGHGIGSALVRALLAEERGPVYLTCRDSLKSYYARFGFRRLAGREMPPYFRRLTRFTDAIAFITSPFGVRWRIIVMGWQSGDAPQPTRGALHTC